MILIGCKGTNFLANVQGIAEKIQKLLKKEVILLSFCKDVKRALGGN